tara:strand:+ start:263 stop:478 length:216 start_codon:yes stop_codon:yes gene_type:complete
MTQKLVLTLYKTLFKKLKQQQNEQGLFVLQKYTRENKNIVSKKKINFHIQLLIDKLIFINTREQYKLKIKT